MITESATTPTTTPAAIPAVFTPPPDLELVEGWLEAVTTIVWPAFVMTDTPAGVVVLLLVEALSSPITATVGVVPVRKTSYALFPPPRIFKLVKP